MLNGCRVWWEEYCGLKRIFGVEGELEVVGSRETWRNCVRYVHEEGWQEEVRGNLVSSGISKLKKIWDRKSM